MLSLPSVRSCPTHRCFRKTVKIKEREREIEKEKEKKTKREREKRCDKRVKLGLIVCGWAHSSAIVILSFPISFYVALLFFSRGVFSSSSFSFLWRIGPRKIFDSSIFESLSFFQVNRENVRNLSVRELYSPTHTYRCIYIQRNTTVYCIYRD